MRFLFIVQGEGRGHMTQAIALGQILDRRGHHLCAALVGKSLSRRVPAFFPKRIRAPVHTFESPNFKTDPRRRRVSILGTALETLIRVPKFIKALKDIHRAVRHYDPDVVVNFYDPLGGLYGALCRPQARVVCIAHQILSLHPEFIGPDGRRIALFGMRLYTRICSLGADMRVALSFRPLPDLPHRKLRVVPPLLREEIRTLAVQSEDFLLVYVVNDGYAVDLVSWHRDHPEQKIIGFWDRKGAPEKTTFHENLIFYQLDDQAFLDAMGRCMGLVTTAGFESVCEAMYLGKPVFMMPTGNQIEQHCNAIDAFMAGAGIWGFRFELDRFLAYIPEHRLDTKRFRTWTDSADSCFIALFDRLKERQKSAKA
jgi:uncharacterized protein (TIGR00661 family)